MNAPIHKELPSHLLNAEKALRDVTQSWDTSILKELTQYIEIPASRPPLTATGKPTVISIQCSDKQQNGLRHKR